MALNQSAPPEIALNQVSGTAEGFSARTFRDNSAGINFVVLQEAALEETAGAGVPSARTRNDGSSFMIEVE